MNVEAINDSPTTLAEGIGDEIRRFGIAVCRHAGSDVEHRIVVERNAYRVTTINIAGVLCDMMYPDLEAVAADLKGSELISFDLDVAVNG